MADVLVIDDSAHVRDFLRRALERAGHRVVEAEDGAKGVRLFRQHPADLVITDIYMPEKEGLETIREIRSGFPGARIIAITGYDAPMKADRVLEIARALGAAGSMKKPLDLDQLMEMVDRTLNG